MVNVGLDWIQVVGRWVGGGSDICPNNLGFHFKTTCKKLVSFSSKFVYRKRRLFSIINEGKLCSM